MRITIAIHELIYFEPHFLQVQNRVRSFWSHWRRSIYAVSLMAYYMDTNLRLSKDSAWSLILPAHDRYILPAACLQRLKSAIMFR